MNLRKKLPIALGIIKAASVSGCSLALPCGIMVQNVELTEKPGTLHITLEKHASCTDGIAVSNNFSPKATKTIEVKTLNGVVRTEPSLFRTSPTKEAIGLNDAPIVDQPQIAISHKGGSKIEVKGGRYSANYYLPDLKADQRNDFPSLNSGNIISWYSGKKQRLFFIYSKANGKTGIASCKTGKRPRKCKYVETDINFGSIDTSGSVRVIDSLNLVGLPVMCCMCINEKYYSFNQRTVVRQVESLTTGATKHTALDSRIGVGYSVSMDRDGNLQIMAEPVRNRPVTPQVSSSVQSPITVDKEIFSKAFGN